MFVFAHHKFMFRNPHALSMEKVYVYALLTTKTFHCLIMVFVTVFDSFNAKSSALVADRDIRSTINHYSSIINSSCSASEHAVGDSFDIGLHRAQTLNTDVVDDLNKFLRHVYNENSNVYSRVERDDHENNSMFVYFSNVKSTGCTLNINGNLLGR